MSALITAFWIITKVFGGLVWAGLAVTVWRDILRARDRHRDRRPRRARQPAQPEPAVDEAVTMLKRWDTETRRLPARKPQATPWPDGDTVVTDGMTTALNEMLKGDGRG